MKKFVSTTASDSSFDACEVALGGAHSCSSKTGPAHHTVASVVSSSINTDSVAPGLPVMRARPDRCDALMCMRCLTRPAPRPGPLNLAHTTPAACPVVVTGTDVFIQIWIGIMRTARLRDANCIIFVCRKSMRSRTENAHCANRRKIWQSRRRHSPHRQTPSPQFREAPRPPLCAPLGLICFMPRMQICMRHVQIPRIGQCLSWAGSPHYLS